MWRINVVLETALLLTLVGRRAHLRWPGLTAFLGAIVARDAFCIYADWAGEKLLYCWSYYLGSAVAIAAEVWLIREIALKLVGPLKSLRAIVAKNVPAMTAVFIVGSAFASLPGHHAEGIPHLAVVVYFCRRLDLAASAGCSAALIMLIGIAVSLKIPFSRGVLPITVGLLIETAFSYIQAVYVMDGWVAQSIFPSVRCVAYLTTLICFAAPALTRIGRDRIPHLPSALPCNSKGVTGHAYHV